MPRVDTQTFGITFFEDAEVPVGDVVKALIERTTVEERYEFIYKLFMDLPNVGTVKKSITTSLLFPFVFYGLLCCYLKLLDYV